MWVNAATTSDVIMVVFHEGYKDTSQLAIDKYMDQLKVSKYTAILVYTERLPVEKLKRKLIGHAKSEGFEFNQVAGINLYGDVVSTKVLPSLLPRSYKNKNQNKDVSAVAELAFDDLRFFYKQDTLIDIHAGYFMPHPNRWVSHQFKNDKDQSTNITDKLDGVTKNIVLQGTDASGTLSIINLKNELTLAASLPVLRVPDGIVLMPAFIAVLPLAWKLTGWGRLREGYQADFWGRLETTTDKIMYPLIYTSLMTIGYSIRESLDSCYRYLTTFKLYQDDDTKWKKKVVMPSLLIDGLVH